jgi:hypothetical protein
MRRRAPSAKRCPEALLALEQQILVLPQRQWIADYVITVRRMLSGKP